MQVRALALGLTIAACGGGAAPEIRGLEDQVATVGQELQIRIDGTSRSRIARA
jgi:hypothetical protein